jgi:hypothetical protein
MQSISAVPAVKAAVPDVCIKALNSKQPRMGQICTRLWLGRDDGLGWEGMEAGVYQQCFLPPTAWGVTLVVVDVLVKHLVVSAELH